MPNDLSQSPLRPAPAVDLDADSFFAEAIGAIAATLEDVVGFEDAAGLVARVGNEMGRNLGDSYRDANGQLPANIDQIVDIFNDVNLRIGGNYIIEHGGKDRICLSANQCPFAGKTHRSPSLCMMTTNVFGRIAADALGYASVRIEDSLAVGHSCCRVTVNLNKDAEVDAYEFFG